ncbi:hypothetical protein HY988_06290 [Candidatus Micrarchaeota archaeon]|nr:hypothetical protein [Candidatus Micrarchaeota archaeon]
MDKKIVLPGDRIAEGRMNIPNAYTKDNGTYAAVVGTLDNEGHYIALENKYRPFVDDVVIGIVISVRSAGYEVELNMSNTGFIPARMMRMDLSLGDFVLCKIKMVNEVGDIDLGEVRRLPKGKVVQFPSAKVPRLIGRKSSMLILLKEYAGGDIMVGNNGYVWISEKSNVPLLLKVIKHIEKKAHKSGLTDEVSAMLQKETGGKKALPMENPPSAQMNRGMEEQEEEYRR